MDDTFFVDGEWKFVFRNWRVTLHEKKERNVDRILTAGLIALIFCAAESHAQVVQANVWPFDVPTDPRTVAMGESFVALPGEPTALMSNPAGLVGLQGIGLSYAQRSLNWLKGLEDFKYHSWNAYLGVPFGVFAMQYNRYTMGEVDVSTTSSPQGVGRERIYEHSFAVGFGTELAENFSAGVAAKLFDVVHSVVNWTGPTAFDFSTTPAFLLDLGAQYTVPVFLGDSSMQTGVTWGVSLQNFGTNFKTKYSLTENEATAQLPRYLRIGVAFHIRLLPRTAGALQLASLAVTAEYRNLLNGSDYPDSEREHWGFGAECTMFEIFSVRVGGVIRPYSSIYGEKGRLMARSGVGLRVPLAKLGVAAPLAVSCGYALIPINRYPNGFMTGNVDNLSTFSVGLEYTETPW